MDLETLCRVAGQILEAEGETSADGRVRSRPDGRTLRYYTTIGLLDRPERQGRVGHYGRKHLLQTLAIKRLQAEGASLAEVQSHLIGLTTGALEAIAKLPSGFDLEGAVSSGAPSAPPPATEAESAARGAFWAVIPEEDEYKSAPKSGSLAALRLANGAVLLLAGGDIGAEEQAELERAAQPLLRALKQNNRID